MKKFALLGALALSAITAMAHADDKPVRIGIEAAYPPFSFKTPDGQLAGFDVDIGNALCEEMKVKCTWVEQEFDGLIPALKVRKIDAILSSMTITDPVDANGNVDYTTFIYNAGHGGDIVLVRAYYEWPTFSRMLGLNFANLTNGNHLLAAVAAFKNEPFAW